MTEGKNNKSYYKINVNSFPIMLLLLFFFVACSSGTPSTTTSSYSTDAPHPDWYEHIRSGQNILRGVGEGQTQAEADALALAAISREIDSLVMSEIQSITRQKDGISESRVVEEVLLKADRQLRRARRIHHNRIKGVHYVAIEVDARPDATILAERVKKRWVSKGRAVPAKVHFEGPRALIEGKLATRLRRLLSTGQGQHQPSISINLSRKDEAWILSLAGESLEIADTGSLFDFSVYAAGNTQLELASISGERLSNRLSTGDEFVFRIKGLTRSGYLSLFNVYSDGRVSLVAENLEAGPGTVYIPEEGLYFVTTTLAPGVTVLDEYIAVFTGLPLDLIRFRRLAEGEGLVSGEASFGAHILADFLDRLPEGSDVFYISVETR